MRVVLEQGGLFGRWGTRIPWILCVIAIIFAVGYYNAYQSYLQRDPHLNEKYFSHSLEAKNKVAIITIEGAIMHNDGFAKLADRACAERPRCQGRRGARRFPRRHRHRQRLSVSSS